MQTIDNSTLVTATGGYSRHDGAPPFVPDGYLMAASPRWAVYGGHASHVPYAPARLRAGGAVR